MDAQAYETAAELCRLVDAEDLLGWLGLEPGANSSEALAALDRERKRLQAMQGNTKYRDVALYLIKNHRRIAAVLADVAAYRETLAKVQIDTHLPLLELAIEGVLADGVLTPEEATFVRDQALRLGIAAEVFEQVFRARCEARGVAFPEAVGHPPTLPPHVMATGLGAPSGPFRMPMRTLQMAQRTAGSGWWDDAFTRQLLTHLPPDTRRLVDLSCGLGWLALALLPSRPDLEYLGLDPNPLHVSVAQRNLVQAGLADRAMVKEYDPANLPLPDRHVDAVTSIMSLQGVTDTRPLFRQAARILAPGGRLVVVEADCLGQRFWFDGPLPAFDDAFRALCQRVDRLLSDGSGIDDPLGPPGLAIGPAIASRMRAVGIDPDVVTIHPVQSAQHCTLAAFTRRLRRRVDAMREAGGLTEQTPEVAIALDVLNQLEEDADPGIGTGVHLLPLFIVVGYAR